MKKLAESIRRVGLIANPEKPNAARLVRRAAKILTGLRRTVCCDPDTAGALQGEVPAVGSLLQLARSSDLLLVFGGDGTMLRVARDIAGLPVPLLGINAGHLGFLAAVPPRRLADSLKKIPAGRFAFEQRSLLEATISRGGRPSTAIALNDFVLSRGMASRLIEIEVWVNDELLTRYRCDGFIASSPTGSTAYSLAAGGAIVSPDADVLTLTPICPHTLSIRPLVISLDSTVRVKLLSSRQQASLSADGQDPVELSAGDTVVIRRSERTVRLLRLHGASFFSTLRQKFGWSGGNL
ncbi:MAG TPA: NAD(+)/NADH kinase [Candidatus Limnocylindria bacterium]|nr:NAD(+)/NADH kinase [Candidatus Limnocylindria bacterium]